MVIVNLFLLLDSAGRAYMAFEWIHMYSPRAKKGGFETNRQRKRK